MTKSAMKKKQELNDEGFSPSEKELTIEITTDKGTIKIRTRPDNTFIKDGKPAFGETKTGNAKLTKNQKLFANICKTTGSIKFCGPEAEKYLEQNKEKFNEYQKDLKDTIDNFKGSVKELEKELDKFNKNWAKKQLGKEWNEGTLHYEVDRHPSHLKGK
ncbi:hypothetical protein LBE40_01995 [Bartonella taylorii]|uniref:Uncharacterized protein n=1 Tax=Bartonella taylorii 8TBB TaxID=1094560 RepID=A0A9P2RZL9_BARTA|nr:hypothetical protein [Bartonella taylorii]EJF95509.1 hypothetical protein ME9_00776 [Bartonella taylorii 8TBB]USP01607.1 hypothetical protein LBE40_01995 [Bartonella taylorii]